MNPIKIKTFGKTKISSVEVCSIFLDTNRWTEFKGYSILPGIQSAQFEIQTPEIVGSRINVQNMDGTSHVEEIIEWDVNKKIALKFQDFNSPLKHFATHFIEEWNFSISNNSTEIIRSMKMYPKGFFGWLLLLPISRLMKKAFEKNAEELGEK
jgi:hypothetical protein